MPNYAMQNLWAETHKIGTPKCGNKRGSTKGCIKQKGHVSAGDNRHWDGVYEWGGYRYKESDRASDRYR